MTWIKSDNSCDLIFIIKNHIAATKYLTQNPAEAPPRSNMADAALFSSSPLSLSRRTTRIYDVRALLSNPPT